MSVYLIDIKSHGGDGKAAVTRSNTVITDLEQTTTAKARRTPQNKRSDEHNNGLHVRYKS